MTAACLLVRSPACSARQLQTSIVQVVHLCPTGFRKEPCERLERHKPKGLRVVLRGLGSSNAPRLPGGGGGDVTSLPDTWVGNHPGLPGPRGPTPNCPPCNSFSWSPGCFRGGNRLWWRHCRQIRCQKPRVPGTRVPEGERENASAFFL